MGAAGEQKGLVAQGAWGPAIELPICVCSACPAAAPERMGQFRQGPSFVRKFDRLPLFLFILYLVWFSAGSGVLGCFAW